jgi:chorismate dehydratase
VSAPTPQRNRVRIGAVGYLNARPLVYGLEHSPRFSLRFDVPARCADLLHAGDIDLGLIPSIEYLRGPQSYGIVPDLAVASNGPVASVALYTRKEPRDMRSIALDTTSRTSVALTRVVAKHAFKIDPELIPMAPGLRTMLDRADGALIIGDTALFVDHAAAGARKIDLGELWTEATGLPFVYAFWAGRPHVVDPDDVAILRRARDAGVANVDRIAAACVPDDPARQAVVERYLRNNIRYALDGAAEEGLRTFYRYAAELGLVGFDGELRFYHAEL